MEAIRFDRVTFTYPMSRAPVLSDISFAVEESEFLLICGKSGCGKTTLLRQVKKNLIPYGELEGSVEYFGVPVEQLEDRRSASQIGFVQQNPDNQIVTDKVWHELAFGLENLGLDNASIRRRVAEMASYFDIQSWFRRDVASLSGGQKQLLNLASIMVMQPRLLVLDEPTSQLDPIAASEFLQTVRRINRDLGVTVMLSEHRLEEAFTMADRVLVMDQGGVLACDTPRRIGRTLAEGDHPMFHGLPAVTKIYHAAMAEQSEPVAEDSPLTVREGRLWLKRLTEESGMDRGEAAELWRSVRGTGKDRPPLCPEGTGSGERAGERGDAPPTGRGPRKEAPAVALRDLWFRYDRTAPDVLRDLSLRVYPGECYAVLGGNGVGKTTMLKAVMGLIRPQRGKRETAGPLAMLPQNPQALFSEITAEEELLEALAPTGKTDEEKAAAAAEMLRLLEIGHLRETHPYDLSGGEQQRLALGKVLLLEPEILLLDEPTKGLDPFFKITLAEIFRKLTGRGITILMVSHDIEFCARYADRCGMFFDGGIVSEGTPEDFFAGNSFYTTAANRIAREVFPEAVTWEEVAACAGKMR